MIDIVRGALHNPSRLSFAQAARPVRANPEKLLAAREPVEIGASPVLEDWTATIRDPAERRRTFEIFTTYPFINAGFAAGTARAFLDYLGAANRLLDTALVGVGPWGDQVAMNRYIHTNPGAWLEVPDAWNYCLACRDPRTYRSRADGRVESRAGHPVHVVHGNGRTLGSSVLSYVR